MLTSPRARQQIDGQAGAVSLAVEAFTKRRLQVRHARPVLLAAEARMRVDADSVVTKRHRV